ncbi:MAG: glycoside hydrolase family 78 protein [Clostridia bacterium]|nr:glycoside hydrolase family 78 protein [Clostridia bacterium]
MNFPSVFYKATKELNTYEKHVNAPYIRKNFKADACDKAIITVSSAGFYDLYLNGRKITKGLLAPYISNPDDIIYFDEYDVTGLLKENNSVCLILGNGMQNSIGGRVWDFDIARFRNVPSFAMSLTYIKSDGSEEIKYADESFKCHPSPIIFDDLRSGCFYDANLEIDDWMSPSFDDSSWDNVMKADMPRGEFRLCEADPIVITQEVNPVEIKKCRLDSEFDNRDNMKLPTQMNLDFHGQEGTLFDFGKNTAGICRLKVNGKKGQKICIIFSELKLGNGNISVKNTGSFYPVGYGQTVYYVCKGANNEVFEPAFCYMGYRYALAFGLDEVQISDDTLTMLVANSDLKERANFECSDNIMNSLGKMSRISDLANFYYFPTDCPHREKNGWTGDAAVSSERMMLTLTPENSYREWLRNICKAQRGDGALPGIVPTGGWGFDWGNGPAWDNVLTELCWQIYRFRGDLTPAKECSESIFRYLSYISQKRRDDGLIEIGLGDWLQPLKGAGDPTAPLYLTDSVISMYICRKSMDLFKALGLTYHYTFAESLYNSFRNSIRENCVDFSTMTVRSHCQTAQSICIYYGVFEDSEKAKACDVLLDIIHEKNDHFDCGMIGIRTLFHVLSDCGQSELAYRMITRTDYPSYGILLRQGLTSLPEDFLPEEEWDSPNSLNHHFMGDIINWFIQRIAGIRVNPRNKSCNDFDISPAFISQLSSVKAHYDAPCGRVEVEWKKDGDNILLNISCPDEAGGYIVLPDGWCFVDENNSRSKLSRAAIFNLVPGEYKVSKQYSF